MQPQYLYNAYIHGVVDGDTVDAKVELGFTVSVDVRFRLAGVDTPELKSSDAIVREAARAAKEFVSSHILDKQVTIKSFKSDKYGRWLAEIYLPDGSTINQKLLDNNLAVPYFGSTKE